MKRLLVFLLAGTALAVPATALATHCETRSRLGSSFVSKAVSGSCTVSRSTLLGTATLRCSDSSSTALVRYAFTLPEGCTGTPSAHVDASGSYRVGVTKPTATSARLTVRTGVTGKVVISMASISLYCS